MDDDFFGTPVAGTPASNTTSPTTSNAAGSLPSRADVKTQQQLMADSIAAIEERGHSKYEQMQADMKKRTEAADAHSTETESKMRSDAEAELKQHIDARDEAVAAAKKQHKEAQSKLLSETKSLEKDGSTWELAAMHCDLSKPNSRAEKSTDKMRNIMGSMASSAATEGQ